MEYFKVYQCNLDKKGSKYRYFVQFQPISDCYSSSHPYLFHRAPLDQGGGKNSKLLRGVHERDERGSKQAGGGKWITVKISNIYCQHQFVFNLAPFFSLSPSSPPSPNFVAVPSPHSNPSYTHHQQPSLDQFEEFLTPAIDHRRYSTVAIMFLSAAVLKVRPPVRLSARGFGLSCSVSRRGSKGRGRCSRCLLAGSRARAARTRAAARPSRGPIED